MQIQTRVKVSVAATLDIAVNKQRSRRIRQSVLARARPEVVMQRKADEVKSLTRDEIQHLQIRRLRRTLKLWRKHPLEIKPIERHATACS